MKVLLVQPQQLGEPGFGKIALVEPLGLEMVAGALLADHEVRIHDMRLDGGLEQAITSFQPDALGISCCFTIDVYRTIDIAETARRCDVPFVFVGGLHASLNPSDFNHPAIDCVVEGEGEFVSRELIGAVETGGDLRQIKGIHIREGDELVFTGQRQQVRDLDELPRPARHLLPRDRGHRYFFNFWKPMAMLETARGCPFRCNFCSVWSFFQGRCRTKSAERAVDEIAAIGERYILITDDNFLVDVKRARGIAALLRERGIRKSYSFQARSDTIAKHPDLMKQWRKAGLRHVFIGFESLDEKELELVNKKNTVETNEKALSIVQGLGLSVTSAFIVNPDYGRKEFARLREYITRHRISVPQFTVLTPLPGTEFFREIESRIMTKNYELYDFLHSVLPTRLDPAEFYKEFASLYRAAYIRSGVLRRRAVPLIAGLLTRRLSLRHMRRILKAARKFADDACYQKSLTSLRNSGKTG